MVVDDGDEGVQVVADSVTDLDVVPIVEVVVVDRDDVVIPVVEKVAGSLQNPVSSYRA